MHGSFVSNFYYTGTAANCFTIVPRIVYSDLLKVMQALNGKL